MSIHLHHITKRYEDNVVVDDVSLEIEQGELFVLLGPSGSGKSTILRLIAGLTHLNGGQISLNGRNVTNLPPQKRHTGFVFQNYSLFQHMTVAQNIGFGLEIQKVPRAQRKARIEELLDLIEMREFANRLPSQLSGGQQQRVAVARALAQNPDVLLLDEPFGALDVKIRGQLRQNLREIQKRLNVTAILVTHDQEEAFELADRIGIIDKGRLLEIGTPDQLYRHPNHRFTATFLGNANLFNAQRNGTHIYIGNKQIPAPPNTEFLAGKPVQVMFRPEEVVISPLSANLNGNLFGEGVIESIAFAGALERVAIKLTSGEVIQALLSPDVTRSMNLRPGDGVKVSLKNFHLLPIE